jgi:hypothetical protein
MKCEYCEGDGWIEIQSECGRVASMCCGGCTVKVECHICESRGYLVPDHDDQFAHDLDVMIQRMKIRIIIFKGYVDSYLRSGEIDLSNKYAKRVEVCEIGLKRMSSLLYNHIESKRL